MKAAKIISNVKDRFIAGLLITILLGGMANVALASTEEWIGLDNNDSNWTSNGNWRGVGGARQNDDLEFKQYVPRFGFDDHACPTLCTFTQRRTNYNDFDVNTSFNSLKFSGYANYTINGNQMFLAAGIKNFIDPASSTVINANIILGASQAWSARSICRAER